MYDKNALAVYVPNMGTSAGEQFARQVEARSGIVGIVPPSAAVPLGEVIESDDWTAGRHLRTRRLVYFEGNIYSTGNIVTFADRVYHAADRLVANYPTVAKSVVKVEALLEVGVFDHTARVLRIDNDAALAAWLGLPGRDVPPRELEVTR